MSRVGEGTEFIRIIGIGTTTWIVKATTAASRTTRSSSSSHTMTKSIVRNGYMNTLDSKKSSSWNNRVYQGTIVKPKCLRSRIIFVDGFINILMFSNFEFKLKSPSFILDDKLWLNGTICPRLLCKDEESKIYGAQSDWARIQLITLALFSFQFIAIFGSTGILLDPSMMPNNSLTQNFKNDISKENNSFHQV